MKILHIITQKPNSTGSGIYLSGMIKGFEKIGHKQAVIAGIDVNDDVNCFPSEVSFYPVKYNCGELNFPVVGMSDSMPYESTRYKDLNIDMINRLKYQFKVNIDKAMNDFKPELIICHHLYLLTAFVREIVKDIKVISICHGTCLRQLNTIDLEKEYIIANIRKLDLIFALHENQKYDIIKNFGVSESKVVVIGSGYNDDIFYNKNYKIKDDKIKIVFAGKICKSKGLIPFIKAISKLKYSKDLIEVNFAGTGSDIESYNEIVKLASKSPFKMNFLGKLEQRDLAELFNRSQIFVLPSFYEGLPVVVLEALSCGTDVITTDILGVKEWIGSEINNSGKIEYVSLPFMEKEGIPKDEELYDFENNLYNAINSKIQSLLNNSNKKTFVDMSKKTWDGLAYRINEVILMDELCLV
ncbi:glycosyltransferase family 4 protein [Clostridioides difficile]|uniref:glycosyltransferase family 4 protein n=1 Tax=Clostridioides difficile TaxID=1496 RepID=UPI0008720486|nr:glycosyltransferase family 4 protein [Clostridioides difficile]AXU49166.1 glycosyl transferase [Clostridioides difficile]AXU63599.1 glycosyl transferase [Clostridioides difficile]EGT4037501.1 glycosyltransferase [Clostridioides difficile]EGT5088187.1 glycosyltransferase [Clostridioides difficile]EGT5491901.1 glycosyltransferase [Clostridioides difficile]